MRRAGYSAEHDAKLSAEHNVDVVVVGGGAVAAATVLAVLSALPAAARHDGNGGGSVLHITPPKSLPHGGRHYALSRRSRRFLHELNALPPPPHVLPVTDFFLHAGGQKLHLQDKQPLCYMTTEKQLMKSLQARLKHAATHRHLPAHNITCACGNEDNKHGGDTNNTNDNRILINADGQVIKTRLLAAADGARSPLATQLGLYGSFKDFKQTATVAEISTAALPPQSAAQWFNDNESIALLPLGNNRYSVVWSAAQPLSADNFAAALSQRTAINDIRLCRGKDNHDGEDIPNAVRHFPLAAAARATRTAPRAALLGDAAGTLHPLAGQGLNLGLGDAETFARYAVKRLGRLAENSSGGSSVSYSISDRHLSAGLAAYHFARARRSRQLQHITQSLLPSANRNALLFAAARLPLMRRLAIWFANA